MIEEGMGGHQSTRSLKDEWLTPPELLEKLGEFDLDPCSPIDRPWSTAREHYTVEDNGLLKRWQGRVWCNPPYGRDTIKWLVRCAEHDNAIALIFARTETEMFFKCVWERATAALFLKGRLSFYHSDGSKAQNNGGAPSVLVAYGKNNATILQDCGIAGKYITL
jgi:hypothetical protein